MGRKLGIDLGTSFSRIGYVDDSGVTRILATFEDGHSTPSIVYFDPEDETCIEIGTVAKQKRSICIENYVQNVKNYLGDPVFSILTLKNEYSPVDIYSIILQKILSDAEIYLDEANIEGVVMTCPPYFGDSGHSALMKVASNVVTKNGKRLNVLRIINELEAAAIAYNHLNNSNIKKTVLIYDLGGTFDTAVFKLNSDNESTETTKMIYGAYSGDFLLGGMEWDYVLARCLINKFCQLTGEDEDEIWLASEDWRRIDIEKIKMLLTAREKVRVVVSFNNHREKIEISREDFESETVHLLDRTICIVNDMMYKAGISMANDIDEIVLVGGASKMPQVRNRLQEEYNKPIILFEPEFAVAKGAAIIANESL